MYKYQFINYNKHTIVKQGVNIQRKLGAEKMYFLHNFFLNPKLFYNKKLLNKKKMF